MKMLRRILRNILPRRLADALHEMKRPERLAPLAAKFGIMLRMPTEDRRCLEGVILPWFARQRGFRRILFVGCDWYSSGYHLLFRGAEYATLDFDPGKKRFGARRHIVAPMQELGRWFSPGSLDLVVCNGVVGWGLNAKHDLEVAFRATLHALRSKGVLVIGWNDVPKFRPIPLESIGALQKFAPLVFEPLGKSRVRTATENKHVFDFYTKIGAGCTVFVRGFLEALEDVCYVGETVFC